MKNAIFDRIYKENYHILMSYSSKLNLDFDNAKDSVQDAFSRLSTREHLWNNPKPWLFTVCRNITFKKLNKNKRMFPLNDLDHESKFSEDPQPDECLINEEHKSFLITSLSQLNKRHKEIINLRYFLNLSYEEIGKKMNLNESNVGFILHTAIKKLKKIFLSNIKDRQLEFVISNH